MCNTFVQYVEIQKRVDFLLILWYNKIMKGVLFMKYMCVFWTDRNHYEKIIFENWSECFDYLKFFIKMMGRKIIPFITSSYFKGFVDDGAGIKLKITDDIDLNKVMYNYVDTETDLLKTKTYFRIIFRRYTPLEEFADKI